MTLDSFEPCALAGQHALTGTLVTLRPFDFSSDKEGLSKSIIGPGKEDLWRYLLHGPFETYEAYETTYRATFKKQGAVPMVIDTKRTGIEGIACYLRNRPEHGSTEVGNIVYSHALQRSREATEAMYLMASHVFDGLNYRRYEWKCNAQNAASRRAAERLGFRFEGIFRQDQIVKGQNRDTAWFSIIDSEWPMLKAAFQAWLSSDNFDEQGHQRRRLEDLRQ